MTACQSNKKVKFKFYRDKKFVQKLNFFFSFQRIEEIFSAQRIFVVWDEGRSDRAGFFVAPNKILKFSSVELRDRFSAEGQKRSGNSVLLTAQLVLHWMLRNDWIGLQSVASGPGSIWNEENYYNESWQCRLVFGIKLTQFLNNNP